MPIEATFERKILSGQYVIVSKELPGFLVSAPTREEAERRLPVLLAKYIELMGRKNDGAGAVIERVSLDVPKKAYA